MKINFGVDPEVDSKPEQKKVKVRLCGLDAQCNRSTVKGVTELVAKQVKQVEELGQVLSCLIADTDGAPAEDEKRQVWWC